MTPTSSGIRQRYRPQATDPNDPNAPPPQGYGGVPSYSPGAAYSPGTVAPAPGNQNTPYAASNTQATNSQIQGNLRDVYDQFQNNRAQAGQWGQNFDQQQSQQQANYQGQEQGYNQLANNLYAPIWGGGGGYTQQQQSDILQQPGLAEAQGQNAGNYLSPDEMQAMQGNPYAGSQAFGGRIPQLEQFSAQGNAGINNAFQQGVNDITNTGQGMYNTVGQYAPQVGMSDQEVTQSANASAANVGAMYSTAQDKAEQEAKAAGQTNPMALAALREQNLRESGAAQADALNSGTLAARGAQRTAQGNVMNAQLGVGQAALGASEAVMNTGVGVASTTANNTNQLAQYEANNITNQQQQGEAQAAQRAAQLGTNRQASNQYNQNINLGANNALSQRFQTAYNPWLSAQAEGRQAATGQQQYAGSQANTATQYRLGGQQVSGNQVNQATSGYGGWGNEQNQVGFGSNFNKSFGSGLGSTFGNPSASYSKAGGFGGGFASGGVVSGDDMAPGQDQPRTISDPATIIGPDGRLGSLGEEGPEAIIPLNPNRRPQADHLALMILNRPEGAQSYASGGVSDPRHVSPPNAEMLLEHQGIYGTSKPDPRRPYQPIVAAKSYVDDAADKVGAPPRPWPLTQDQAYGKGSYASGGVVDPMNNGDPRQSMQQSDPSQQQGMCPCCGQPTQQDPTCPSCGAPMNPQAQSMVQDQDQDNDSYACGGMYDSNSYAGGGFGVPQSPVRSRSEMQPVRVGARGMEMPSAGAGPARPAHQGGYQMNLGRGNAPTPHGLRPPAGGPAQLGPGPGGPPPLNQGNPIQRPAGVPGMPMRPGMPQMQSQMPPLRRPAFA